MKKDIACQKIEKEKLYSTADNLFEAVESNISANRVSVLDSYIQPTITEPVSSNDSVDHCSIGPGFTVSSNPKTGSVMVT